MDLLANADLPVLAAGLGLVVLSLVGLLALLVARRRRLRRSEAPEVAEPAQPETEPAQSEDETVPVDAEPAQSEAETGQSLELRTLRAQVHCLEQALAQLPGVAGDPVASYRAQVRAAVRAVAADVAPGDDARYVLDRLTAAVDRLDQPGGLTRPTLPAARGVAEASVPLRSAPAAPVLSAVSDPQPGRPTEAPADGPVEQVVPIEPTEPVEASEPEEEHVVPVPPPAVVETRRPRRRLRRSAA